VRVFFIQHRSAADALPLAQREAEAGVVTGVDHVVVASYDLDATLALWRDAFGLDLRRTIAWSPERTLHFLRLGNTILELAGSPQPSVDSAPADDDRTSNQQRTTSHASDLLWGVSYRVDDAARTVERLRAARIDVSDARTGRAGGTVVANLKPGFSHDVRTLFIQKEAP
jgi:catechol 2,3-dioxygenase-like lactoylglutathione lyase family enzyme